MRRQQLAARVAAGVVASLAVLLAFGPGVRADQPKDKAKAESKPLADQSKDKGAAKADARERLKELRAAVEKARKDIEKANAEMRKAVEAYTREMRKLAQETRQRAGRPDRFVGGFAPARGVRLGVLPVPPSPTLRDQLNLPEGKGIVVAKVLPGSPAAKGGLKEHDVLLELNGKAVPSDDAGLRSMLADIKPDAAVDVVVLRKGKRETIKGLKLSGGQGERPRPPRPNDAGARPSARLTLSPARAAAVVALWSKLRNWDGVSRAACDPPRE
jgi:C-terminal processing protease CtpA/Prc